MRVETGKGQGPVEGPRTVRAKLHKLNISGENPVQWIEHVWGSIRGKVECRIKARWDSNPCRQTRKYS